MSEGWRCPNCGGVYAPWMSECRRCTHPEQCVTTITTVMQPDKCPAGQGERTAAPMTDMLATWFELKRYT